MTRAERIANAQACAKSFTVGQQACVRELEAFIKAERKVASFMAVEQRFQVQDRREVLNRLAALVRKWRK